MDTLRSRQLLDLTTERDGPCVTIYMPVHVAGVDTQQNPIRLKNLLRKADEKLVAGTMRAAQAKNFLKPARDLVTDEGFWRQQNRGLALFLSAEGLQFYRLPIEFSESLLVSRRFDVKPLIPFVAGDDRFCVLAISQNKVSFFRGSRYQLDAVEVESLPSNMEQALNYDQRQEVAQTHSAMRPGQRGEKKQAAVFHGQGGQRDVAKDELDRYCRLIDGALRSVLNGERFPLFLVGADPLVPIYRQLNTYPHLAEQPVKGNADYLSPVELHAQVWPLVEASLSRVHEAAAAQYQRNRNTGRVSTDLQQIVPAAHQGKIDTLFIAQGARQWGTFDVETQESQLHTAEEPGDDDLVDLAAVQTMHHRGAVYTVGEDTSPGEAPIAALFRF